MCVKNSVHRRGVSQHALGNTPPAQCMLGYTHTPGRHPPGQIHPGQTPPHPLGRHPPWTDTPLDRHPLERHPHGQTPLWATPRGRHPHLDRHPPAQCMHGCILLKCILVITIALLAMIAHLAVQTSTRTLFTMLFYS